jgi:hypothetical protein
MASATATLFGVLGILVLWLLPILLVARLAARKRRSVVGFVAACLIVGWPIGLVAVLIAKPERDD